MIGGDVWSIIDWLTGGRVIGSYEMRLADYAAIVAICTVILLAFNVSLIKAIYRRTSATDRLHSHVELVERAMLALGNDPGWLIEPMPVLKGETRALVREVALVLEGLKIPHPPLDGKNAHKNWNVFLPRLLAAARAREFGVGKETWPNMEKDILL